MLNHSFQASVLVLMASTLFLRGDGPAPVATAQPKSAAIQAREMRSKLAMPGPNLEKGVDPNTKFQDAVDFFSQKAGVLILVDTAAFKADFQIDNVTEQPIWLPKLIGLRLSTMLAKLSAAVGGTYLVLPDHILITTPARANPLTWVDGDPQPTVDVEFSKAPLEEALYEISNLTGINIVLDARAAEKGKNLVTAKLHNTPVDTATRLLADMADLEALPVNGALYVTTKENAQRVRAEEKSRPKRSPVPLAQGE